MVRSDSTAAGHFPSPTDLRSEGWKDMCVEGVPFRNPMDKGVGSKRSNSDFTYTENDGFDKFHSMKIYRSGSGSEQPRRLNDEENFYGSKALLKTSTLSQADGYSAIWDRTVGMNVPGNVQYPSYISPFVHQVHPVAFRDAAACPLVISNLASDEGSRNGKTESTVWNSMKSSIAPDKSNAKSEGHALKLPGAFVTGRKLKIGTHLPEPESPMHGWTKSSSSNQQMTIFYDGHAYVFDDVHPSKAEFIMAMAGSNAASYPSTFTAKSNTRQASQGSMPTCEIETGTASYNQRRKPATDVNSSDHEFRPSDQIFPLTGNDQDSKGVS